MTGFDSAAYRNVMSHFATGVVIVTSAGPAAPVGMAVSSFTSVSLRPPLVLFCAGDNSTTWPVIQRSGIFCANILAADQESVARRFGAPGDRYDGIPYVTGRQGSPVLDGVHASLECAIEDVVPGGDHVVVVGRVLELFGNCDTAPLLFHHSRFHDGAALGVTAAECHALS